MPKNITIYSRPTCAPCNQLKQFLNRKGFTFEVRDIDSSQDYAAEAFGYSGASIVPVTVVTKEDDTKEVISGLNLSRLAPLLA